MSATNVGSRGRKVLDKMRQEADFQGRDSVIHRNKVAIQLSSLAQKMGTEAQGQGKNWLSGLMHKTKAMNHLKMGSIQRNSSLSDFCRAKIVECAYPNLDGIAYSTPMFSGISPLNKWSVVN